MKITRTSIVTGITRTLDINITEEQLQAWKDGMFIQDAAPHLSPDDREFIISGITPDEWDEVMVNKEDSNKGDEPAF